MAVLRMVLAVVVCLLILGALLPVLGVLRQNHTLPQLITGRALLSAPWLLPKRAGGSPLRLAMIHDILHERFLVHGPAWFEHRHAQAAKALAEYEEGGKAKNARYFSLLDDFAVDLDRLGRPAEGIPVLRRKLDLQQPLGADGKRPAPRAEFYTTYANLGTLLAHVHLKGALAKDPEAVAGLREGLAFIERSMAVNPEAHFGREVWQAVTLHYLLRASEEPDLLTQHDLVGLSWRHLSRHSLMSTGSTPRKLVQSLVANGEFTRLSRGPRSSEDDKLVEMLRGSIARLPDGSLDFVELGLRRISFDEPALALVGIWTMGSGANPHFALAFAHLMEGLDQPGIAWSAYERAHDLAPRFWPDPAIQQRLMAHCRERQGNLEPWFSDPPDELRRRHRAELAFGRAEQQAYHAYEAERIAAGRDPGAADFYDDFTRRHAPLASDPGNADTIIYDHPFGLFDLALIVQAIVCSIVALWLASRLLSRRKELKELTA